MRSDGLKRRRAADLPWNRLAGGVLLGLAAYQAVNAIVVLFARDQVTAAALRAAAAQPPFDAATAVGRAVGGGVLLAALFGMLTAVIHLILAVLVTLKKGWARIAAMVLAVISLFGLLPALVVYALLPDVTAAQPIFLSLPPSVGTAASLLAIAVMAVGYAALLAVLAWRTPSGGERHL